MSDLHLRGNAESSILLKRTEVLFDGYRNGLVERGVEIKIVFIEQRGKNSARFCLSSSHFFSFGGPDY